jgi:hypothetical protein
LALANGAGQTVLQPEYDFTRIPEVIEAAKDVYQQAGISNPRTVSIFGNS